MVYKIYLDGENVDAEFGQPVTCAQFFTGKYGEALKAAEKLLGLIDFGSLSLVEGEKVVYIANKEFSNVSRLELN